MRNLQLAVIMIEIYVSRHIRAAVFGDWGIYKKKMHCDIITTLRLFEIYLFLYQGFINLKLLISIKQKEE